VERNTQRAAPELLQMSSHMHRGLALAGGCLPWSACTPRSNMKRNRMINDIFSFNHEALRPARRWQRSPFSVALPHLHLLTHSAAQSARRGFSRSMLAAHEPRAPARRPWRRRCAPRSPPLRSRAIAAPPYLGWQRDCGPSVPCLRTMSSRVRCRRCSPRRASPPTCPPTLSSLFFAPPSRWLCVACACTLARHSCVCE